MNSKDVRYVVLALAVILVLAVVVKPIMTGQPINTGLPVATTPTPEITPVVTSAVSAIQTVTTVPTPTPTPVPTWGGTSQTVAFVDPNRYQLNLTEFTPRGQADYTPENITRPMTSYATIPGKYSGTTDVIYIPFPYWELSYTVDPATTPSSGAKPGKSTSTSEGVYRSGIQGSYSSVFPRFTIQVMDAEDPNRIVRIITPPGGLDENLWKGETDGISNDPRPWVEKFYEGNHKYYFVITSNFIDSYNLNITVPSEYIGKY